MPLTRRACRQHIPIGQPFSRQVLRVDEHGPQAIDPAALQSLLGYTWPGNARQLENEVKRLVVSVRGKSITPKIIWTLPFET